MPDMSAAAIVLYVRAWCPYCTRARDLLTKKGVHFEQIDIGERPEKGAEMIQRSRRRTVPQIFIGEHHVGGSDELQALEDAGELDALLRRHGISGDVSARG
jgi:glutaredoxin 3